MRLGGFYRRGVDALSSETDFDVFVSARSATLFRTAVLLCGGDAGAAADAVQNTMIELWRRWPRVRAMDRADAYAHTVLARQVLRGHRGVRRLVHLPELPDVVLPDPTALSADRRDLWDAVRTLPPVQRAVVVLRYFEDMTEAQTAEALGITVGTVKSHASRAMSGLRRRLTVTAPTGGAR